MSRSLSVFGLLSCLAMAGSAQDGRTRFQDQEQRSEDCRRWVARALQKIETMRPGMTREDLLKVSTTEGGLSTGLRRTYVSQESPYMKIDVEFEAVGRPNRDRDGRVTLVEDNRDVIVKVSRPYLQSIIVD